MHNEKTMILMKIAQYLNVQHQQLVKKSK